MYEHMVNSYCEVMDFQSAFNCIKKAETIYDEN